MFLSHYVSFVACHMQNSKLSWDKGHISTSKMITEEKLLRITFHSMSYKFIWLSIHVLKTSYRRAVINLYARIWEGWKCAHNPKFRFDMSKNKAWKSVWEFLRKLSLFEVVHVCNPSTWGQTKIHTYIGQGDMVRYFFKQTNKQTSEQTEYDCGTHCMMQLSHPDCVPEGI